MTPLQLVHGGGLAASCWDRLLPHLNRPALAVDLPGRGDHPAHLESVTIPRAAESVVGDLDATAFGSVVLVGHSLAGCLLPAIVGLLGDRVRHLVFLASTVPEHGTSAYDALDRHSAAKSRRQRPSGANRARALFGNDMDDEQFAWFMARQVPEARGLTRGTVDLSPLRERFPRTWIRTLRDQVVSPDKQLQFARNVGGHCKIVDIDAGHICMVSQPRALADILNRIR